MRGLVLRPDAHAMTQLHLARLSTDFNRRDYGAIQTYMHKVDDNVFFDEADRRRIFRDWAWTMCLYRFVARCVERRGRARPHIINEHTLDYTPVHVPTCILLRAINRRYYAFTEYELVQIMRNAIYQHEQGIPKPGMPKHPYTNEPLTALELRYVCAELRRRRTYIPEAIVAFQQARFQIAPLEARLRPVLQRRAMLAYCQGLAPAEVAFYVGTFLIGLRMAACRRCMLAATQPLSPWVCDYLLLCNHVGTATFETLVTQLDALCRQHKLAVCVGRVPYCPTHYRHYVVRRARRGVDPPWRTPCAHDRSPPPAAAGAVPFRFAATPASAAPPPTRRRGRTARTPAVARAPTSTSVAAGARPHPPPLWPTSTASHFTPSSILRLIRDSSVSTRANPLLLLLQIDPLIDSMHRPSHPPRPPVATVATQVSEDDVQHGDRDDGDDSNDYSNDENDDAETDALFELLGALFEP